MALQNGFYHWSTHQQKSHIYTIQKTNLEIWLFKIVFALGLALCRENYHALINELNLDKDLRLEIKEELPPLFLMKFSNA